MGRVFNYKLGCFNDVYEFIYVDMTCMYSSMWMHDHIYSRKLGPGLVLLVKDWQWLLRVVYFFGWVARLCLDCSQVMSFCPDSLPPE